jgi:hypothetical protein
MLSKEGKFFLREVVPSYLSHLINTSMKMIFSCLLALLLMACASEEPTEPQAIAGDFVKAEGTLVHMLFVDGCDWHFSINLKDDAIMLAPDEASLAKVKAFADQNGGMKFGVFNQNVTVEYRLTGRKKDLQCGWGKTSTLDEIEVKQITKR